MVKKNMCVYNIYIYILYTYIPKTNQIFTKIDKLPSNANTMSHWYSAGVVPLLYGRGVCRVRWSDIHLYTYMYTHNTI